jgi:osmoprotectant transport system ATP-binding protein
LHGEFRRIQSRLRKTVIIVTHDMGEAFALADRVGVLEGGRLIACDRPDVVAASREPLVRQLLDALPAIPRSSTGVVQAFRPAGEGGPEGPHS